MIFKTDIYLKYSSWEKVEPLLENEKIGLFDRLVDLYIVACSIGISSDLTKESYNENIIKTIGRNTLQNNDDVNEILSFLYQNAILNSNTIDLDMETRKKYAFEDEQPDGGLNPTIFLTRFANYGIDKILECTTNHDIETAINLVQLISDCINATDELDDSIYVVDDVEYIDQNIDDNELA